MRTLIAVLAVLLFHAPAAAQITDSVTIEILEPPAAITITAPERAYRGDEVTIAYQIVTEGGAPTEGIATWSVVPEGRATILTQTDSTVTIRLDQPGRVTLAVEVARVDRIVQGFQFMQPTIDEEAGVRLASDRFLWGTGGQMEVGQLVHVCAVALAGERVAFASSRSCHAHLAALVGFVPPLAEGDLPDGSYSSPPVYLSEHFRFSIAGWGEWHDQPRSIVRSVRGAS